MVASASPEASLAAVQMLRAGGNAFDAAVAAAFVLGVEQPYYSGLGGGGFLVGFRADKKAVFSLDFREVAPKGASADMLLGKTGAVSKLRSRNGGLAIAVPGAPAGYLEAQRRFGKLPLAKVMAPAIEIAESGFAVTEQYRHMAKERRGCLQKRPAAAAIFLKDGAVPMLGDRIVQKDLAGTLRALGKNGAKAFYEGPIARAVAESVHEEGGVLSVEDLARFKVRDREPLEGSYRGHRVVTMAPPSAGGVAVLQILNALEKQDLVESGWRSPENLHLFVEASRQAFADRATYLGDPAFVQAPVAQLVSKDYAARLYQAIHDKPARCEEIPVEAIDDSEQESDHTTHISVVDADGNAAALTTTVNYFFGSCVVAAGTGVLLNDQMDDFAAKPGSPNAAGLVTGAANAIAPYKIPLSSMAPTLIFAKDHKDQVELVVGAPGGPTIPTTVVQVVVNALDFKMPLDRALAAPRVHHQRVPEEIAVEPEGLEEATAAALRAMGHTLAPRAPWGEAQAVYVDPVTGIRYGASDIRGEGRAVGE
jgi:gamma-glutamyltranspeptidase/glutathione hydrolase